MTVTKNRPRLYVLPPSHYCERAKWALDAMRIEYDERRWAVGVHMLLARRLAPSTTLPILQVGTQIIQGSGKILDWTKITGGIADIEERFEAKVGVLVRQFIYSATLDDPGSGVKQVLLSGVPRGQFALGCMMWPVTRRLIADRLQARRSMLTVLKEELDHELNWFETQLGENHLLENGHLTRATITAASLLSPLARPAHCALYRQIKLPLIVEEILLDWEHRPGLAWTRRIYENFRRVGRDNRTAVAET